MEKEQTFVLQEVIDDLVNTDKSLVSALMKLYYFGKRTKNEQLIEFTNREMEGYKNEDLVPDYRKTFVVIEVDVQDEYGEKSTLELPSSILPEPFKDALKKISISDGIDTIERLCADVNKKPNQQRNLFRPIPIEILPYLHDGINKLYKSNRMMNAFAARTRFSYYKLAEILNTVRSKLMAFVMEMGDEFGYNIEISSFQKKQQKNNQTVIKIMNTNINNTGDANVTNTGDNSTLNVNITITKGDLEQLAKTMKGLGIEDEDISELKVIVEDEMPDPVKKTLGQKAIGWITNIASKALSGVGKIATSVSSAVLAEYIKQYYGFDK